MEGSDIINYRDNTHVITDYRYDSFGRRIHTGERTKTGMRTIYDGLSFEVVKEAETIPDSRSITTTGTSGATSNEYKYDGSHRRGTRYYFIRDEGQKLRTDKNGEALPDRTKGVRTYLYLNGERVAVNNLYNTNHGQYYYGSDILGSVKFVTGQGGQELNRIEYDVFGGIYKGNSPYGLETGYTGKPYDAVTGLSDYGFRDYSPKYARFITEDPIRDGVNWFAYVGNNPMNWVDPWGLSASDGQKNNSTAVSTGFHIPGLFPTFPKVNVTNSKALNYGIAVGASALNLVSSVGNFVLSGVAYANTLVDKTIDIADKYVPSWLTLNGSVRRDIPAIEFATAVLAPEIALYNQANKIYSQLKSANFLNTLFQNATTPLKRGVTPVGRALQKHSARATSIFYGMSNSGNAAANSAIGKDYLANILANGTKTTDIHPVFNEVIKFRLSDGTGAWWKADGAFIGLLEPYTK